MVEPMKTTTFDAAPVEEKPSPPPSFWQWKCDPACDRETTPWTPPQANYPLEDDEERYPFLNSIVAMRTIKGYVHDENLLPTTTYSFIATTHAGI